jgi:uncharacterized protein YdhG (YjbR/CyaY superfamily)
MNSESKTPEEYIEALPEDKKEAVSKLREIILTNLPDGFDEQISYGMIGYVVPLSLYPNGYHAQKGEPLPFLSLAAQKNYIALYHMGLYGSHEIEDWFRKEYAKRVTGKLDMGKSCIRFKNPKDIPFDLIAELCSKISVEEHIKNYEMAISDR